MASERARARGVLLDALRGDLQLDDFHRRWPDSDDALIRVIFEETEDTVEHTPGSWLRRRSAHERFRESVAYKTLVVDEQFLLDDFADVPSLRLVEIRERLLKEIDLRQEAEALATAARHFVDTARRST